MVNELVVKIETNKRVLLISLVILTIGASFWSGSRYPQLDEKAIMGGDANFEAPLSFNAVIQQQEGDSKPRKIILTTINWAAENKNGMTFGILFGTAFLTLFNLLKRRGSGNGFINTLIGMGMGSPLGVCVNCAAPIAKGMHSAGARLETTLAAMFSSPTLNVVILIMVFSIFPLYLAVIKLTLTLLFIVLAIPLLCKYVFKTERLSTYDDSVCPLPGIQVPPNEDWWQAFTGTVREYLKNLWYIIKTTLPLMILAGLLGAMAIVYFPLDTISGIEVNFFNGLLVALAGIFLPLPIALDIVVVAVLMASGLPTFFVMILLFTLGIYSVYPFFIVWASMTKRVAIVLVFVLIMMGLTGGYIADYFYQKEIAQLYEYFE